MSKVQGIIKDVRMSTKFAQGFTLILQGGEQVVLSQKQIMSKTGISYAHGLKGAMFTGEFHPDGAEIVNPAGGTITQTAERRKQGRGIKDFSIDMTPAQSKASGELFVYKQVIAEHYAGQAAAANMLPNTPLAAPAEAPAIEEEPAVNALVNEAE